MSTTATQISNGHRVEVVRDERDQKGGLGWFLRSVAVASDPRADRDDQNSARELLAGPHASSPERRALVASSGTSGGYLMPPATVALLNPLIYEESIVRPRALTVPMNGSLEADLPMLDPTVATPTGFVSAFGGLAPEWLGESSDSDTSEPAFASAKLIAHPLKIHVLVSRTLLMKSPQLAEAMLVPAFAEAIAQASDREFLVGLGGARPVGVIVSPAALATAARAGASAISFADALLVKRRLLPPSLKRAVWVVSHDAVDELEAATATANSIFGRVHSHLDPETGDEKQFLLGRPIEVSEHLPALNTAGDFGLYDFSKYLVTDPDLIEVATSSESQQAFRKGLVAFRVISYVGGMPWLPGPVDMANSSDSASAFVTLGTA